VVVPSAAAPGPRRPSQPGRDPPARAHLLAIARPAAASRLAGRPRPFHFARRGAVSGGGDPEVGGL